MEVEMNFKDASSKSGLHAKTIRYYEDIDLIKPLRDSNGYRVFRDSDVHKLTFLGRARALGFTIEDCRALMALGKIRAARAPTSNRSLRNTRK
jgi:MerR family copper efflux transcriptional regulator